jgi:hypothetical protein
VARHPINLYFALGVTPRASSERVHAAYRRRAHEVHPDHHGGELNSAVWNRVMTAIGDAEKVLLDAPQRRAYDVWWLRRSRMVTANNATSRERRGDWDTRYHWYMAEIGEIEDRLASGIERVVDARGAEAVDFAAGAISMLEEYEARVLHVRNQTYAVPEAHMGLPTRVRFELQRKDAGIRAARRLLEHVAGGNAPTVVPNSLMQQLVATGAAHRQFEIRELATLMAA